MFKENKYTKWYFKIINKAKETVKQGYVEKHHIIPRCLGGLNTYDNLIELTAREHLVCHLLLIKMHDSDKLKFALFKMLLGSNKQKRLTSSRWYVYAKILMSKAAKIRETGNTTYHNPVTDEERRFKKGDAIPENWIRGWSLKRRATHTYHSGKIGYVKGNIRITLAPNETPPEGFIRGGLRIPNCNGLAGSKWYYSPTTGEEEQTFIPKEGWIKGRSKIWINNGIHNRQINFILDSIPEGYTQGRIRKEKPTKQKRVYGPISDETRLKMSLVKKNKPMSEETKRKISESNKGKIISEETLAKLRGQKRSEEARKNISEAIKLNWQKRKDANQQT
jgi:hypothetical protein